MADKAQICEKLDVEDEDARFQRIKSTLDKLNTPSSPHNSISLPSERSIPHAMPPSDLLARVQAFLPELAASNAAIEEQRQADPSSVDIECIKGDAERYIEMNLGLGLFEQRDKSPGKLSDDDSTSSDSSSESSESDSGLHSDEAEGEKSEGISTSSGDYTTSPVAGL